MTHGSPVASGPDSIPYCTPETGWSWSRGGGRWQLPSAGDRPEKRPVIRCVLLDRLADGPRATPPNFTVGPFSLTDLERLALPDVGLFGLKLAGTPNR